MRIYEERRVDPIRTILPSVASSLIAIALNRMPIPLLQQRRALPDLFARTKLVNGR